ncbi:hypothetical protein [Zhongshania sp.]|uniref:hypothetical protein n=1 Tax=Zhongshania sp. TaxID=1971902 RepID=UPI003567C533
MLFTSKRPSFIPYLTLVGPKALANYDGEEHVVRQFRAEYNHEQLVNHSGGVVLLVMIAGYVAWARDDFASQFGRKPVGHLLRAVAY